MTEIVGDLEAAETEPVLGEAVMRPKVPGPDPAKYTGVAAKNYNRGGGSPAGQTRPLVSPTQAVIGAAVEIVMGAKDGEVAEKYEMEPAEARRIRSLTGLVPQVFFDRLADKFELILSDTADKLHQKIQDGEGSVKDLTIALGVVTDKLTNLRGNARPAVMNQTNVINVTGMDAASARRLLLGDGPAN